MHILSKGRETNLAKLDVESTYQMVPVHHEDCHLLRMQWGGRWYMDTALLFSLRSVPKMFTATVDGFMWIMCQEGIKDEIHYLDDYPFFLASQTLLSV